MMDATSKNLPEPKADRGIGPMVGGSQFGEAAGGFRKGSARVPVPG